MPTDDPQPATEPPIEDLILDIGEPAPATDTGPKSATIDVMTNTYITVYAVCTESSLEPNDTEVLFYARNNTEQTQTTSTITGLNLSGAVPKHVKMTIQPPASTEIPPKQVTT
jgi:hypothetical protein